VLKKFGEAGRDSGHNHTLRAWRQIQALQYSFSAFRSCECDELRKQPARSTGANAAFHSCIISSYGFRFSEPRMLLLNRRRNFVSGPSTSVRSKKRVPERVFGPQVRKKRKALSVNLSLRSMKAVRRLGRTILRSPSNVADTAAESLWIPC
jgi:hypothetical protein